MEDTARLLISPSERFVLVVTTLGQIFIGSISNAAIIATKLFGGRHDLGAADVMVLNLSVADILPCLSYLPWMTVQLIYGFHDEPTKHYFNFLFSVALHCSENAVLGVTLDRYSAICFPLRYKSIMSPKRTLLLTFSTWIIGFIFAIGSFVSYHLSFGLKIILACCILDSLQITSILVLYGFIFREIRKQSKRISFRSINGSNMSARERKKFALIIKSATKTFAVALLYLITFLPCSIYFYATYSKRVAKDDKLGNRTWDIRLFCFTFLNSCINPLIYSFGNARFRKMFWRLTQS